MNIVLDKLLALYTNLANKKHIGISTKIELNQRTYADYNSVFTILRNVLGNAIKFTQQYGTIIITSSSEGDWTVISIMDNGKGMTAIELQALNQLEGVKSSVGTSGERGAGLGMLIVKELLALNQGYMVIRSGPKLSTKVKIYLPSSEMTQVSRNQPVLVTQYLG